MCAPPSNVTYASCSGAATLYDTLSDLGMRLQSPINTGLYGSMPGFLGVFFPFYFSQENGWYHLTLTLLVQPVGPPTNPNVLGTLFYVYIMFDNSAGAPSLSLLGGSWFNYMYVLPPNGTGLVYATLSTTTPQAMTKNTRYFISVYSSTFGGLTLYTVNAATDPGPSTGAINSVRGNGTTYYRAAGYANQGPPVATNLFLVGRLCATAVLVPPTCSSFNSSTAFDTLSDAATSYAAVGPTVVSLGFGGTANFLAISQPFYTFTAPSGIYNLTVSWGRDRGVRKKRE